MAIFRFCKMAAAAMLDFENIKILTSVGITDTPGTGRHMLMIYYSILNFCLP